MRLTIVNQRERGMIDMDTNKIMLQPSEWIIMEKLWELHPKTLMQLYHELKVEPGWSKSTVTTLLSRMVDKGILYYEEKENCNVLDIEISGKRTMISVRDDFVAESVSFIPDNANINRIEVFEMKD